MKNVTRGTMQEKKLEGMVQMKKNEKMAVAINDYILSNDFLVRYIRDGVVEKIYNEREYYDGMIEQVITNDLESGYSNGGYILDYIIDEIDIYTIIDFIHERYKNEYYDIAQQTQRY